MEFDVAGNLAGNWRKLQLLLLKRTQRRADLAHRVPHLAVGRFFVVLVQTPLEHVPRELPLALRHSHAAGFWIVAAAGNLATDGSPIMFGRPTADRSSLR